MSFSSSSSSSYSYSSLDRANANTTANANAHFAHQQEQEQDQEQALSFSLDDILLLLQPRTSTNTSTDTMSMSMSVSTPTQSLAPPPPRSRSASLSHSASLARQTNPPPALRPDSVLYSSPSWAQTMPLPKLHDPLPTALPARASVMAQLPPAMRQLGFLGNRAGNRESLSSDDDTNQEQVYTLDDTPEFRSTISLLEPEGTSSDDSGEFAVLNLDASFHDDIHLMFDADPVYHDGDVDAETHDRSTASSSDATLVHAATPPSIEHADVPPGGRHVGLSLAPMQPPSDEHLARGRRAAPKSNTPPDANRVSVVGDLPTFPRKGSHQHNHRHAPPLPSTQQVASPPTPTRQEVHGAAAVGGGTILGKLKRALSARRTSPHSPTPPPPGRVVDSDASPTHAPHSHQRSNSIDQGIGTLRRALSRATSARRRKSPEDPPIPAPSSLAPNPYHNATAAAAQHQQQQQQQQYQVSPYGTIVYNNHDEYHAGHTDYDQQQQQQQQQFFSPPAESTLGGLGLGGGDELYMATMARGDAESDRSVDHASQEVSTNPFATLAGLPLTVPTRSESRRTSSGAYLLGVPSGAGTGAGTDMANTPPDMHEPVPAVFTLARPSAGAPPLTPTRVEEHGTGYMTMQHTGAGAPAASGGGAGGATDMLAQAREVAGYQTMRRGGR